jgi:hypothetical protein
VLFLCAEKAVDASISKKTKTKLNEDDSGKAGLQMSCASSINRRKSYFKLRDRIFSSTIVS